MNAFPGAGADEVRFELGGHGQDFEAEIADRVGGVVDGSAEMELDVARGDDVLYEVPGVRRKAGETVELGDGQGIAGSACGEGLLETERSLGWQFLGSGNLDWI